MLDSYSFDTPTPIGLHFVVDSSLARPPQKPQHLLSSKTHHPMMHQRWINPHQPLSLAKHHVGRILALGRCPVVLTLKRTINLNMQRMTLLDQRIEQPPPLGAMLLVHHPLGPLKISDPRKTVVLLAIGNPLFVHLPPQPFPSVQANLDQKGKPSLEPKV